MTPDEQYHQDTTERQKELDEQAEYESLMEGMNEWEINIKHGLRKKND